MLTSAEVYCYTNQVGIAIVCIYVAFLQSISQKSKQIEMGTNTKIEILGTDLTQVQDLLFKEGLKCSRRRQKQTKRFSEGIPEGGTQIAEESAPKHNSLG